MAVASPFQSRTSTAPVVLTYAKQRASLTGQPYHQRRRQEDWQFLYRLFVFGAFFMAACLYISHETIGNGAGSKLVGEFLRRQQPLHAIRTQILLHYHKSHKQYARSFWTLEEYPVNGVNLAQYGFEEQVHNKLVIESLFELNEDFDISKEIRKDLASNQQIGLDAYIHPTTSDLLAYRRHLDHPSLAFYMDKIAQKYYHQATGIPVPNAYLLKYRDEWQALEDDQDAIENLLPEQTDYAVKPSHHLKGSSILVNYNEDTQQTLMGTKSNQIQDVYDAQMVAKTLAQAMHREVEYSDPWALLHVQPGLVVEERITSFDSPHRPAMEMQVYVIWGRVWMASWPKAEGPTHPGLILRNGTVIMDDHVGVQVPKWVQWETIVAIAEDLGRHKDLYQVNVLVGLPAETAHLLQHSPRPEQLAAIQVVVTDVKLDPTITFSEKELLDEMGRLWLAGYEMGIYRTIPNPEVPLEFRQRHKLTAEDAEQPHILEQWAREVNWKSHSDLGED